MHWKDWCWSWSWSSNTLATWCEEQTHWKRPWCWERLRVGGEGVTEDEMVGWHHQLNGHEFEQSPGDSEGQGSLRCCSPWGRKEWDTIWEWTATKPICEGSNHLWKAYQPETGPCHWHLPSMSIRIKSYAANFPYLLKGVHGREQKWGILCSKGKSGRAGLQVVRDSQESVWWSQLVYLLIPGKALKSIVTDAPHD